MIVDVDTVRGACHCRTVQFRARLSNGLRAPRRCNCSYCAMRGAVVVSAKLDDLEVTHGADALTLYQFGSMTAKHYFCSRCGIYTHHQRRSNPKQYGVNVACFDGLSPFDFEEVPVTDGINHSSDIGGVARQAGVLRYFPTA